MLLYVMTIVSTLVCTAIAFDKDRSVPAWYCFALAVPLVMFKYTGSHAASAAASLLPVALIALLPHWKERQEPTVRGAKAAHRDRDRDRDALNATDACACR